MLDIYKKIVIILPCLACLQGIKTCDPGQEPDGNGGCKECAPGLFNPNHNPVDSTLAYCIAWTKCNEKGQYILKEGSAQEVSKLSSSVKPGAGIEDQGPVYSIVSQLDVDVLLYSC
ncbi:uncharacterized protein LOC106168187 [Lingula anatina]|uniref:Uncharacterized protein LOC106168187 n=1 Tax=Lingula anatina TaxID=7574 RepID=A0A1S3IWP2_LINAN|nr:uncharacterized protein LOC106168187 [Lingula anatina]XP_013402608.1 uncharacterized protein LOC106168187 [Lingula anatina]|eukprot:XP_013402607.1 uncharacterized protein LOC106168187 [Lingula anatina]